MMNIIIRKLEHADTIEIENIFDLYWHDEFRKKLSEKIISPDIQWLVAENNTEIIGVIGWRKAPEKICVHAKNDKVAEIYVLAVKYQNKGIGSILGNHAITQIKNQGFQEIVFFSGNTHQDAWVFHDNSGFKRAGDFTAPDGESGKIWLMEL